MVQIAAHPVTVNIIQEWNWTDVATLAMTLGLVCVAGVELWTNRAARKARELAADRRVSASAHTLQHKLIWWLGDYPLKEPPSGTTAQARKAWASRLWSSRTPFGEHVQRVLALAVDASAGVSDAVNNSAIRFYRAVQEAAQATSKKDPVEVENHAEAAKREMIECEFYLTKVINREMLFNSVVVEEPTAP